MKIVQTYWSLPSTGKDIAEAVNGRNKGGWPSEKYHAMSWALSSSKFNQFYPEVNLYTDNLGYDWLVNKLGLSYSNVFNELDVLNDYNVLLWALPKVYVYAQQKEAFIHADGDVFIWEKFSKDFIESGLLVQNLEINYEYYKKPLAQIAHTFKYIPAPISDIIANMHTRDLYSINAGVIGGQNVAFYKKYAKLVFEFVDANLDCMHKLDAGNLNIIFEQLYFYYLATEQNISISTLLEEVAHDSPSLIRFDITPIANKFIHVLGYAKKSRISCSQLEIRLKYEFPKLYKHIISIYKEENNFSVAITPGSKEDCEIGEIFTNSILLLQQLQINYTRLSFDEICHLIEKEFEANEEEPSYKLLADIYQIEKCSYLLRKSLLDDPGIFTDNMQIKATSFVHHLYNISVPQFLQIKFMLDTEVCRIAYLNHCFPQNLTTELLASIATQKSTVIEGDETRMLLIQVGIDKKQLYTKALTDWNTLLYYFDGEVLSGNELIEMIATKQVNFEYTGDNMERDVLNFLGTNCLYFSFLKIIQ